MIYNKEDDMQFSTFKTGLGSIEQALLTYEKDVEQTQKSYLGQTLEYISKKMKRKMIIFVITDLEGLDSIEESTVRQITCANDMLFLSINDAYMTGDKAYDIESDLYIPSILLNDKKLYELERKMKEETYAKCTEKLKKYNVQVESISEEKEIVTRIISLLERHRGAK